jgi:hypothetical protein
MAAHDEGSGHILAHGTLVDQGHVMSGHEGWLEGIMS